MSDNSITIVPKISTYAGNKTKAKEILQWLTSLDVVKPFLSDCVLSEAGGYSVSDSAKIITTEPELVPTGLGVNGLEIITRRQIFDAGANGLDECICPNCENNIATGEWSFFNEWHERKSDNITCPLCRTPNEVHQFRFSPEWGFSDLGFIFWNWPPFTENFIEEFKLKLNCDVSLVFQHI